VVNRLAEYDQSKLPPAAWRAAGEPAQPDWQDRLNMLASTATRWVTEHPEIALTAAVATGVIVGWFIKRR